MFALECIQSTWRNCRQLQCCVVPHQSYLCTTYSMSYFCGNKFTFIWILIVFDWCSVLRCFSCCWVSHKKTIKVVATCQKHGISVFLVRGKQRKEDADQWLKIHIFLRIFIQIQDNQWQDNLQAQSGSELMYICGKVSNLKLMLEMHTHSYKPG